ncbi:hypothetical protein NIES3275_49080 [Microchaete diplosiphon NIES-3275]|nr:hypothetical protein NIES3275_49080 [Microchaete diplosiphon NIES-3275]
MNVREMRRKRAEEAEEAEEEFSITNYQLPITQ